MLRNFFLEHFSNLAYFVFPGQPDLLFGAGGGLRVSRVLQRVWWLYLCDPVIDYWEECFGFKLNGLCIAEKYYHILKLKLFQLLSFNLIG